MSRQVEEIKNKNEINCNDSQDQVVASLSDDNILSPIHQQIDKALNNVLVKVTQDYTNLTKSSNRGIILFNRAIDYRVCNTILQNSSHSFASLEVDNAEGSLSLSLSQSPNENINQSGLELYSQFQSSLGLVPTQVRTEIFKELLKSPRNQEIARNLEFTNALLKAQLPDNSNELRYTKNDFLSRFLSEELNWLLMSDDAIISRQLSSWLEAGKGYKYKLNKNGKREIKQIIDTLYDMDNKYATEGFLQTHKSRFASLKGNNLEALTLSGTTCSNSNQSNEDNQLALFDSSHHNALDLLIEFNEKESSRIINLLQITLNCHLVKHGAKEDVQPVGTSPESSCSGIKSLKEVMEDLNKPKEAVLLKIENGMEVVAEAILQKAQDSKVKFRPEQICQLLIPIVKNGHGEILDSLIKYYGDTNPLPLIEELKKQNGDSLKWKDFIFYYQPSLISIIAQIVINSSQNQEQSIKNINSFLNILYTQHQYGEGIIYTMIYLPDEQVKNLSLEFGKKVQNGKGQNLFEEVLSSSRCHQIISLCLKNKRIDIIKALFDSIKGDEKLLKQIVLKDDKNLLRMAITDGNQEVIQYTLNLCSSSRLSNDELSSYLLNNKSLITTLLKRGNETDLKLLANLKNSKFLPQILESDLDSDCPLSRAKYISLLGYCISFSDDISQPVRKLIAGFYQQNLDIFDKTLQEEKFLVDKIKKHNLSEFEQLLTTSRQPKSSIMMAREEKQVSDEKQKI